MPDSQTGGGASLGDFFRYHGWLSPGVRLFRSISFPKKTAWVAMALLVPLAVMLTFLLGNELEQIDTTKAELDGVAYVRPLLALERASHGLLAAALANGPDLADKQSTSQAAFAVLQKQQDATGKSMGLGEPFAALKTLHEAVLAQPRRADAMATLEAHRDYAQAMMAMLREVGDGSTLALDPELDTFHLMNIAVLRGPREIQNLARMRSLAASTLEARTLSSESRALLVSWLAEHHILDEDVENSFQAIVEATPEVAKLVDMPRADDLTQAFYQAVNKQLLGAELQGDAAQLRQLGDDAIVAQVALMSGLLQRLDHQLQARVTKIQGAMFFQLGLSMAFVAMAAYLMLAFYRVMMGGLSETRRHLRAMTEGDLTTSPSPWGNDEAAQLMLELRAMQNSLRGMVLRVRHSSDEIVHSSSEIASGALDLSSRTEQAAANLQQSAASMEEISSTVTSTADNTQEAARVARHNVQTASDGGRAMGEVVQTMEGIRTSSAQIGEIVGTIDSIAFQTNILALNAAVEAARAGEQGRGFAVVASEVRMLAQRSAEAAREIKVLISRSVEQVQAGASVVRGAGTTIEEIVASSQRVDQLLGEVANGAREQSLGIGQIGQAVQDLDRMTQQNAAMVEQTASAAAAMKDQAHTLAEEVARFKMPAGLTLAAAETSAAVSVAGFDFDKAIDAHRQWKVKLRKAISDHEKLDGDTICRDDQCPLGKWIHGPGGAQWGGRPTFVDLQKKHAEFHQAAGNVARQINAGKYEQAEKLIGSGSSFAQVSTEVATILTRAKRGL
jgi:methyl-accepting chemotaxis protein